MRAALIAVAAVWAFTPPMALAANGPSSGVHVDPGSPAGKQYSLPIASARNETLGYRSSAGAAGSVPFGAGVTPATRPASAIAHSHPFSRRTPGGRRRLTDRRRSAHRTPAHGGAARSLPAHAPAVTSRASRVGESSWMPLVAGGSLVLLLGGVGGLALRRRISDEW